MQGADTTITDLQRQVAAMQDAAVEQLASVRISCVHSGAEFVCRHAT